MRRHYGTLFTITFKIEKYDNNRDYQVKKIQI